jgi:hypothetical protein
LTLFARAGTSREAADAAIAAVEIHELPAARNCTYVLPASDFAVGLRAGQSFWAAGGLRAGFKLGVTEKEIGKLCDAVQAALGKGPLTPDEIRDAAGKAVRNLGEEGKKKGLTTTLPLALGKLQAEGEIRRIPTNGRLDQQRYRYALWEKNPLRAFKLSAEETMTELARRFFAWMPPATLAEFQTFSGLGLKAATAAVAPLKLEPVAAGDQRLMFPSDRAKFAAFQVPKDARYALVSGLDSIVLLRGHRPLCDPDDLAREVFSEKDYRTLESLGALPNHAILDRGRVVGLWEYDTEAAGIAWTAFVKKNRELERAVARTEEYVRTQLGDARSFSLDSPKSRAPRVEALRKAAAG